ncbi:hypothetical protein GDV60_03665 [Pseudomonas sp. DTU12.1]|nr:hypothetical protein GDV60_03665 [Pseudomonas sp. DTU12.1]
MARVHASADQYRELFAGIAAGPGHYLRLSQPKCGQCGSWLACDGDGESNTAIAGKPAPTVDRVCSSTIVC